MQKRIVSILISLLSLNCFAQSFSSKHFTIHKLTDGVYAAIYKPGGYSICNGAIIDLGDATLIFDPFMAQDAAMDLKKAALELTGRPVKYVVNSHYHNDHIGGNQVFDHAQIISTVKTKQLIAQFQQNEITSDRKSAPQVLSSLNKDELKMSQHDLEENKIWRGYFEAIIKNYDSQKVVLPNITFDHEMVLHGTKRDVKLLCYGTGHTKSDLFLFLPKEKIAFMGDLLFKHYQPWLGDGDPVQWRSYLDKVEKLNIHTYIPGHGPLATNVDIDSMKLYFDMIRRLATNYHRNKKSPKNDVTLKIPGPFRDWYLSNFFKDNVVFEYNRLYLKKKK